MRPRRRTLLKALGSIGLVGGGVAYWQRRRIRRRDRVDDVEAARDVPVPSIAEPLSVSADHVEASYARARRHVEDTEALLPSEPPSNEGDRIARAWTDLEDHAPGSASDDGERLEALEAYRLAVAESATARGLHYGDDEGAPSEELRERRGTLESELAAFEGQYAGDSLTRVVVHCGEADSLSARAASSYERATEFLRDETFSNEVTWELVEVARMRLRDAEWFCRTPEGPDRTEALSDRFERLVDRTDADLDDADFGFDGDARSHAATRWGDAVLADRPDPDGHLEAGRPALAVREQASRAVVAATLGEFEDLPGRDDRDPGDVLDDAAALVAAKRTAVAEIEAAIEAVGSDPLGRHLLGEAIDLVERGDRDLDRLLENVRSYDESEWLDRRDRASLRYREAAANADAIPAVVREVAGPDTAA